MRCSGVRRAGRAMTTEQVPGGAAQPPETTGALAPLDGGLPARFGKNVFMNYAAQGLTALSAVVLTPILLHHLGKSTYGLWVVASGAVAYLELFELGFGGATTKLISEDASVRPEQALRTLNTTFFVLVPLGIIALVVGVGLSFVLPHLVHVPTDQRDGVIVVVVLLALGLAASIPGDTFGGALVGHQRYDLLAASNASMTVAIAAVSIAVVVTGGGIVMLAVATTVISILFHLVRLSMVSHIMPGTRISPHLVDKKQRRNALHLSGWFLIQAVEAAIYATGDVMIVGIVLGLRDAAIYAVGSKFGFCRHQRSRRHGPGVLPHAVLGGTQQGAGSPPGDRHRREPRHAGGGADGLDRVHRAGLPGHPRLGRARLQHLGPGPCGAGDRDGLGLAGQGARQHPDRLGEAPHDLCHPGRRGDGQPGPVDLPGARHGSRGRGRRDVGGDPPGPSPRLHGGRVSRHRPAGLHLPVAGRGVRTSFPAWGVPPCSSVSAVCRCTL